MRNDIGFLYQDIDKEGGYPRDVLRLFNELREEKQRVVKLRTQREFESVKDSLKCVHIFGIFQPLSFKVALRCLQLKIPYVITPFAHLLPVALKNGYLRKQIFLFVLGKKILNNANFIHVFTKFEEESLKKIGIKGNFKRISLGLYPEDLPNTNGKNGQAKLLKKKSSFLEKPYLVFLGRLDVKQKGIDILIKGFELYAKESANYNLVICGRDWKDGKSFILKQLKRNVIQNRINFLGEVNNLEKDYLIENAKAFIYPSRYDGPPRPLRYALLKKKKILVSREANISDQIEENGWGLLFDITPEDIARKILKFENKKNWPKYINPMDILSWGKLSKKYLSMYNAL